MKSPNFKEELELEYGPALFERLIMDRFGEKGFEFLENRGITRMERPKFNMRPEGPKGRKRHPLTEDEYSALKSIYGETIMGIPRDEIERDYETLTGIDVEDGLLPIRKMKGEQLTGDELNYIEQVRKAAEARGHGWVRKPLTTYTTLTCRSLRTGIPH